MNADTQIRLLLTSDLHQDKGKLRWLLDQAPTSDAILIPGDLLDIFSNESFVTQTSEVIKWKEMWLKSGKSLAWSSGNHDFFHGENTPMLDASPAWMRKDPSKGSYITDGESRLLKVGENQIAITTLPWPFDPEELILKGCRTNYADFTQELLQQGKKLQTEENVPWIVLTHEPPADTPLSVNYYAPGAEFTRKLIESAQPDFSLHGHAHYSPTAPDGLWIWQMGTTICFNAGQSEQGENPYHILLKIKKGGEWKAIWNTQEQILHAEGKLLQPLHN